MKSLVGKSITYAHFCEEHGWVFEFDDVVRVEFNTEGATWYVKAVN